MTDDEGEWPVRHEGHTGVMHINQKLANEKQPMIIAMGFMRMM